MFLQGSDGVEVVDALVLRRVGGGAQGLAPGTLLGKVAAAQLLRQHLVQKVAFLGDGHGLFQRGGQHFQPKALGLETLPASLEEAVEVAKGSEFLHKFLPDELSRRYYAEALRRCEALKNAADPIEYERVHYFNAI